MSIKPLKSWSGLFSIFWLVGIFEIFGYPPFVFLDALFGVEKSQQLSLVVDLLIWLGVGLLFAIVGLRCWKSAGQLCSIAAICIFIYFAWRLLHPVYVPDAA